MRTCSFLRWRGMSCELVAGLKVRYDMIWVSEWWSCLRSVVEVYSNNEYSECRLLVDALVVISSLCLISPSSLFSLLSSTFSCACSFLLCFNSFRSTSVNDPSSPNLVLYELSSSSLMISSSLALSASFLNSSIALSDSLSFLYSSVLNDLSWLTYRANCAFISCNEFSSPSFALISFLSFIDI